MYLHLFDKWGHWRLLRRNLRSFYEHMINITTSICVYTHRCLHLPGQNMLETNSVSTAYI